MKKLISTNPAKNYEEIGSVDVSTEQQIISAVAQARAALPEWKSLSTENRGEYVQKISDIISSKKQEVETLITREMGKPLTQSASEVDSEAINAIPGMITNAVEFMKKKVVDEYDDYHTEIWNEPYGVMAVIAPWNYPVGQWVNGVIQALLAGNTIVFKHSEECPLVAQWLDMVIRESGLPAGVLTTVYGGKREGKILLDQNIDGIHFTGSTKTGKEIYKIAAEKFIPVVLEMGGSSPGIVFPSADISTTCESIFEERYSNCGQVCCALKRAIVHEDVYDQVVEQMKNIIDRQVVGDPEVPETTVGPLVAERQKVLLEEQIQDAKDKGAEIYVGGTIQDGVEGAYVMPMLITGVTDDMRVVTEETFGPLLTVQKFANEDEAIEMANDTPYGLSAFVYGDSMDQLRRVADQLQTGLISLNGALYFSDHAPFGGYKGSGMGRVSGVEGYQYVTQSKVVSVPKK